MELQQFFERIPSRIRDQLIDFGLLDANQTAAGKPLSELISEFKQSMRAKERTPSHIRGTVSAITYIFEGCKFKYWSDISPAKVESYLKEMRDKGISYRRSNGYLTAIKSFCEWMVKSGYAIASPLKHLAKLNTELDKRRERRAATPDELRRLLESTKQGPERFGLSGHERTLVYWLAAETGLRANEIRTLKVSSFDFDNNTVKVESAYSKHREQDILPLKDDLVLATELQNYFANKLPAVKAFSGRNRKQLTDRTADMLKADLVDAGISYTDDVGLILDFHGLRHTFVTNLKHAPSRVAQALARHKSSAMTDRYTHIELHDERAAIEGLPDLTISSEKQRAIKTGTDDNFLSNSCFQDAHMRTNTNNSEKKTISSVQKAQLSVDNEGTEQTHNPLVEGSNPIGPIGF